MKKKFLAVLLTAAMAVSMAAGCGSASSSISTGAPAACEPVLQEAREKGIVVICHEGSNVENCDYDIEAFNNAGYGAFIMDNLAGLMGESGTYTTMVGFLTTASHNEWADGAVDRQKEAYSNMTPLADLPRVESENNTETAYEKAKEVLKKYPEITGFTGSSSDDTPGIARAINELGLGDKVHVVGTGMPNECRELLKNGSLTCITLWDPADAGYVMCELARKCLDGEEIGNGINLGLSAYDNLIVDVWYRELRGMLAARLFLEKDGQNTEAAKMYFPARPRNLMSRSLPTI